jgi:hypothetical protein
VIITAGAKSNKTGRVSVTGNIGALKKVPIKVVLFP